MIHSERSEQLAGFPHDSYCSKCFGTGTKRCEICGGSGKVGDPYAAERPTCATCLGMGKVVCGTFP